MEEKKSFLGTGWSFPPTFVKKGRNAVEMVDGIEDVKQSLIVLLTTSLGERVMRHDFGASLESMMFENLDVSMITYMTEVINNAILNFESRIEVHNTLINTDTLLEGKVIIEVDFTVASENTRTNIVFPFYINEGTDIVE